VIKNDATGISTMVASHVSRYFTHEPGGAVVDDRVNSAASAAPGGQTASYTISREPTSFAAGQSVTEQVALLNTGTTAWTAGGSTPFHLGIHFAARGGGANANSGTWLTDQRYTLPNDVAPGQHVTLSVTVTAPTTRGSSRPQAHPTTPLAPTFQWSMVWAR
jgi:hypothetical protein